MIKLYSRKGYPLNLEVLKSRMATEDVPAIVPIHDFARSGDLNSLMKELNTNPKRFLEKDKDGKTVLMLASYNGHTGMVHALLEFVKKTGLYSALNDKNNIGNTAIICACIQQNTDIACSIAAAGADIYIKNNNGQNGMYWLKSEEDKRRLRKSPPSVFAPVMSIFCFCT